MKKIMIVDDNPSIAHLMKIRLQANGYQVVLARNGLEGLNMARQEKPDLVVLDIMMPELDGCGFAAEIKSYEDLKHIPIVVVTSRDNLQNYLMDLGAEAYLLKPIDIEKFLNTIKSLTAEVKK